MPQSDFIIRRRLGVGLVLIFLSFAGLPAAQSASPPPNIVIIFLDDAGWSDFQPFGATAYPTPHVDQLAREGTRFNNFYVPQAVCSASRAALLSGAYPGRTKVFGAHGPFGEGLDPKFATMAEVFKANHYATAHFGKWHIGDTDTTRPHVRGFDEHAGLLYSNDMWKHHATDPVHWGKHPLQFWENGAVAIAEVTPEDQTQLTTWATERAVSFIERHQDQPFFLYVAHSMPHVPLFCSDKFLGKSGAGLYGDVMMELDWSVGEIMSALDQTGLAENTLVIFSSDNGPWTVYGNHAGHTPFREAKGTSFDGGVRSPTIMRYPGHIPAGTVSETTLCTIDLLPTLAHLTSTKLPANEIDGRDVWPLITGDPNAKNPHEYYAFSNGKNFEGIITSDGRWKLHLPHGYRHVVYPAHDGAGGKYTQFQIELSLFDLKADPYETTNVIAKFPDVAQALGAIAEAHRHRFYGSTDTP
jgi:arylsulfatase A